MDVEIESKSQVRVEAQACLKCSHSPTLWTADYFDTRHFQQFHLLVPIPYLVFYGSKVILWCLGSLKPKLTLGIRCCGISIGPQRHQRWLNTVGRSILFGCLPQNRSVQAEYFFLNTRKLWCHECFVNDSFFCVVMALCGSSSQRKIEKGCFRLPPLSLQYALSCLSVFFFIAHRSPCGENFASPFL